MESEEQVSNLYRPSLEEGSEQPQQNCDRKLGEIELMSVDRCDGLKEMDDLQLVGDPEDTCIKGDGGAVRQDSEMVDLQVKVVETGTATARVKQKAGRRPPRGGKVKMTARQPPPGRRKIEEEEEDVCFICFDGGSLVLCDRKGCPKAYHPACIKREESFFQSKAKWNCGWHICSICEKASYYMCYTCTYSLCKGCTKGADFYSVRGNKGLCGICMKTILLIENCALENQEKVEVDFDDKTSWEYLFKVYWILLKEKLLLTVDEVTGAKNPWKEPAVTAPKRKPSCEVYDGDCTKGLSSGNFCGDLDAIHAKRRKTKKQPEFPEQLHSVSGGDKCMPLIEGTEWATNELLELVALMRNGDTSMMSQFDVLSLLLEYIKKNNLRDPHKKSQIVCDYRLLKLFGEPRLGHFEMQKLLESHFVIHEHSPAVALTGVVDASTSQVENDENHDNQLMMGHDNRHKTSKNADMRGGQPNVNAYAVIDVHNINLIYLKRCSVEKLINEADKFNDRVVGSIVRIRLPVSDQKQDIYRLVQVVGTSKAAEPYKIGERTTDVILEIRNLQKKEVVAIDAISNQEFSEDECSRLCESIKCGFIKHLTVGEIQDKAMSLQALRVNELLESEILRLNNLRDRASEKGHRKELRELVEKLQILNSPEERKRRLLEIPEVHADPKMDPSFESEEDAKEFDESEQDIHVKPRKPSIGRKEKESSLGSNAQKGSVSTLEGKISLTATDSVDGDCTMLHQRVNGSPQNQGKESIGSENNQVGSTIPVTGGWNDNAVQRPEALSEVSSGELSLSNSPEMVKPSINFETENMWHYKDPFGRIQGPFSMLQLRKWSTSGCFPPDFRVWRISQKQDDSVLLTDVLNGLYDKKLLLMVNRCLVPQEVRAASDDGSKTGDCEGFGSMDTAEKDCKSVEGSLDSMQNDGSAHSKSNDEDVKSNGGGCQSSSLTTPADVNSNEGKIGSLLQCSDPLKDNHSLPDQLPPCNSLQSPMLTEKSCETMLHQFKEKHQTTEGQINIGNGYDKQVDHKDNSGQSSRKNCRPPPIDNSSNGCDSNSVFVSFAKALDLPSSTPKLNQGDLKGQDIGIKQSLPSEAPVQHSGPSWITASRPVDGGAHLAVARSCQEIVFSDLHSPMPKSNHGDLKSEDAEIKQSLTAEAPVLDSGLSWSTVSGPVGGRPHLFNVAGEEIDFSDLPGPTSKLNHGEMKGADAGIRQSLPSKASVQDSGPSWSTASSPVGSRPHLPDVSGEWGGYPPTPAKVASDHAATPNSGSCQPTHFSPSHPASNAASWQAMVVPEPDEFTTLGDESVSDLLAEVEAMESLNRFASTSDMRCGMEFTPENHCFSPIEGLSPTPDAGKSDAFSSSSDLQMHSHSTVTDEPRGVSQAAVLDPHKRSGGHSSMSAEVDEDTKPSNDSINQCKVGSKIQPALPPVTSWDISAMDSSWRLGSETVNISQRGVHGNSNFGLGGFSQERIEHGSLGADHWTAEENFSLNMGTSIGNPGIWESHPRYVGGRLSGPRDHGFHGGDSSFDRSSSVGNGQVIYDVENGGSFRLPSEGQRVCKFYESGYCRKGASCSYWHR